MKKLTVFMFATVMFMLASVTYGVATDYYVTTTGAAGKDGLAWASAFDIAAFEADLEGNAEAGDRYFVAANATYTITSSISTALDGSAAAPIKIIGVKTGTTAEPPTTADWAFGVARPDIELAVNDTTFIVDNYWHWYNLDIVHDGISSVKIDASGLVYNCKFNNTGTNDAINLGANETVMVQCEIQCAGGTGVSMSGAYSKIIKSYIHDCATGFTASADKSWTVLCCVIDTCTTAFLIDDATDGHVLFGNTITGCTTAISGGTSTGSVFINNLNDGATTEATWDAASPSNFWDYNLWEASPTRTNVTAGVNAVDTDVTLNADFSLQAASAALSTGMGLGTNQGIAGADYKVNIGADGDDNAAGGGTTYNIKSASKDGGKQ